MENNQNMGAAVITKKTKISLEFVILIVVFAISLSTTWIVMDNKIDTNTANIANIQTTINANSTKLTKISDDLASIANLINTANKIAEAKMSDRYTAGMMVYYNNKLKALFPEIDQEKWPEVREIQQLFGY